MITISNEHGIFRRTWNPVTITAEYNSIRIVSTAGDAPSEPSAKETQRQELSHDTVGQSDVLDLVRALNEPPLSAPSLSNLGISEEWLEEHAADAAAHFGNLGEPNDERQQDYLKKSFIDLDLISKTIPRVVGSSWTDDPVWVHVLVRFVNGKTIQAEATHQPSFMLPWTLKVDGNNFHTFNAAISRAVAKLLPSGSVNKVRLEGSGLMHEIVFHMDPSVGRQWKDIAAEEKAGDALNHLREKYAIRRMEVSEHISLHFGPARPERAVENLQADVRLPYFPNNLVVAAVFPLRDGHAVDVDTFLENGNEYEHLVLDNPWIVDSLKRTMAGEYSRELSVKVFAGQCRLIELGYRQGGSAGYGLRRQLIDQSGAPKGLLKLRERKSIQTDRVVLVPGPESEIAIVREIFERFASRGEAESQIAAVLNSRGIVTDLQHPWTGSVIKQILTNPKYIGTNVFNRRSFKLKRKRVKNPPEMWIVHEGAFEPIVQEDVFTQAQAISQARNLRLTDDQLLERLRQFLVERGTVSGVLIDEAPEMPSSSLYASRFGGLYRAYQLIGWNPNRNFSYVEINRYLRRKHADLVQSVLSNLSAVGAEIRQDRGSGLFAVNRIFTASLVLSRCYETPAHSLRWLIRFETSLLPDVTIAARLSEGNAEILDYYMFPRVDVLWEKLRLAPDNGVALDLYRFDNLSFFTNLARRVNVEAA